MNDAATGDGEGRAHVALLVRDRPSLDRARERSCRGRLRASPSPSRAAPPSRAPIEKEPP